MFMLAMLQKQGKEKLTNNKAKKGSQEKNKETKKEKRQRKKERKKEKTN